MERNDTWAASQAATAVSRNPGSNQVSASAKRIQRDLRAAAPDEHALAFPVAPRCRGLAAITPAPAARARSAVLSVEPSSTTTTVSFGRLRTARWMQAASLRAGITTVQSAMALAVERLRTGRDLRCRRARAYNNTRSATTMN